MRPRPLHVVWFKRDLRVEDHRPLLAAARAAERDGGAVLPLHLIEPALWAEPDRAERHWDFIRDCLLELDHELKATGSRLIVRTGEAVDVFADLHGRFPNLTLHAHEETGNMATFRRDMAVRAWARDAGVSLHETPQAGVIRGLKDRRGWAKHWDVFMAEPVTAPLKRLPPPPEDVAGENLHTVKPTIIDQTPCPDRQRGGRAAGLDLLHSFLTERAETYRRAMSTPNEGWDACSRLSPFLAYGALSMREVAQATWAQAKDLRDVTDKTPREKGLLQGIDSFIGRLHWRDHFTQKLEDAPHFEFENMHAGYDGMRDDDADHPHLRAWSAGRTGLPFVDACMRCLAATGWMNFRMRAMLQATACYHLWRHWRAPALILARAFTDYEPGIHYPQSQMQAGVTGINTVRVYNPVKQGHDQDPDGVFTARWAPELRGLPPRLRQEPWKASPMELKDAGLRLGVDYPDRIVDHEEAAREARGLVYARRRDPDFRTIADAIQEKHGTRKSGVKHRGRRKASSKRADAGDARQSSLDLT